MSSVAGLIPRVRPVALQFTRFCTVGLANTALTLATFRALEALGVPYLAASAAGWSAGALNGYVLNRAWTFGSDGSFWRFALVQLAGLGANVGGLALLVAGAGLPHLAAQAAVLPGVSVLTFVLSRELVFGPA